MIDTEISPLSIVLLTTYMKVAFSVPVSNSWLTKLLSGQNPSQVLADSIRTISVNINNHCGNDYQARNYSLAGFARPDLCQSGLQYGYYQHADKRVDDRPFSTGQTRATYDDGRDGG